MPIKEWIENTKLVSCPAETPVDEVADLMKMNDVGSALILDEEHRPVGIVTDRDLVLRCLCDGLAPQETTAREIMSSPVQTSGIDDGLFAVVDKMTQQGVRRLPIVDHEGRALALVSFGDVFRLLAEEIHSLSALVPSEEKLSVEAA